MIIGSNTASANNLRPALAKPGKSLSETRANEGAPQAQPTLTGGQLAVSEDTFTAVASPLQDVDAANASTELARTSILGQSATAMLAQANWMPQSALQLLQQ